MYQEFYNFTGKPFQLIPDLNCLFASRGHMQALSYFNYGLEQGEGFVTVTGEIGAGKTTLIQALLAELEDKQVIVRTMVAANLDSIGVLEMIASVFDLPHDNMSKVVLLKSIEALFLEYRAQGNNILLVVDEAQTLNADALEELRILSNLEDNGRAVMQVFLVGQAELRTTILSKEFEHLRQRIIASYHLDSLTEPETKDYIKYRLESVGWNNNPSISKEVYNELYRWSGGIPRRINLLCDRLFVYAYLEEKTKLTKRDIMIVVKDMNKELGGERTNEFLQMVPEASNFQEVDIVLDGSDINSRLDKIEQKLDLLLDSILHTKKKSR